MITTDKARIEALANCYYWTVTVAAARDDPATSDALFDSLMAALEEAERAVTAEREV